jgi:hypothetical protein
MTILSETENNFEKFFISWTNEASVNWTEIHKSEKMLLSYRRIAAFQSLKLDLASFVYSESSMSFFHEAHNDALVSHISASLGAWRLALQSLRSFIENSLCAIYYHDHPIELRNWERGKKKIGFSELVSYFESHPDLENVPPALDGIKRIKEEYKTLSLSVHASAKQFRMTDDVSKVLIWSSSKEKIAKWSAREGACLTGIALTLIALNKDSLNGTQKSGLRTALSFIFMPGLISKIKSHYKIVIQTP